jgi:predicted nucleic acid-binding protein
VTRTATDSSVLVAALASWHESHAKALRALETAMAKGSALVVPADALLETYAVLTRLPAPHRISPAIALELLRESFRNVEVVALDSSETWGLLEGCAAGLVAGGTVYDARIVVAAVKGRSDRILTLNARHFERLAPTGLEVVVPGR